ncbi:hypothetical protein GOODEAATRI_000138, partial [Goodea atripinnis]
VVKKPAVNSSDEWCAKRPSDDTVSIVSSLHSSPTVSPQGSPRKGCPLLPTGKSDNLSDSSHSEISSRSSICSVDSAQASGPDDRFVARGYAARPFSSSLSTEELTPDHTSLDSVVDSGRGSWTSCSSNSHESFQILPTSSCRPWDHGIHGHPLSLPHMHLSGLKHTSLCRTVAEAEAARPSWANDFPANRHTRDSSSDLSEQVRESWTSSGSLSDNYEGNYGTIKRRNTSEHPSSPANEEGGQSTDASYKTVTSSTEKGLIVYCVTSPTKDERYRAPPPTPPGYQGLALGDLGLTDGVVSGPGSPLPRPPHLRPPDYNVALQRSKLLQSPGAASGLAEARRLHLQHQDGRAVSSTQGNSIAPSICHSSQDLANSEDGRMLLYF